MGFKEIVQKLTGGKSENKEMIKQFERQVRTQRIVEDRLKSANERELERFKNEDREEQIKSALQIARNKKRDDIAFGHNILDTKNVTSDAQWHVLREKNMFKNNRGNMFVGNKSIHKNNPNLLHNNPNLFKSGGILKWLQKQF